jgi:excisionase family DNA binding protein
MGPIIGCRLRLPVGADAACGLRVGRLDPGGFLNYHAIVVVEEGVPDWLSSAEAAEHLGLTPGRVRELIASGALRARRVGNRFLVSRDDVEARASSRPAAGRPYSPRRAWGLIFLASGTVPAGIDPVTLSKLRRILREADLWSIRRRFASRAERRELRAHSSDLVRLEDEPGVVRTGARHAAAAGINLIASDAPVELYLDPPTAERLIARYQLRPSNRSNVVLHVVPPEVRRWLEGPVAPPPAVALDLADDRDSRSQDAARAFLART